MTPTDTALQLLGPAGIVLREGINPWGPWGEPFDLVRIEPHSQARPARNLQIGVAHFLRFQAARPHRPARRAPHRRPTTPSPC